MLLSVVSSMVMAQQWTGRVQMIDKGTVESVSVYNSSSSAYVIANRSNPYSYPCVPAGTAVTGPRLAWDGVAPAPGTANTLFESDLARWAYPANVVITKLSFRFCYNTNVLYNGLASNIYPIYLKQGGSVNRAPTPSMVFTVGPMALNDNGVQSAEYIWNLDTPIQSADWNIIEFGFQESPSIAMLNILGMEVRAFFTPTTPQGLPVPASLQYLLGANWGKNILNVNQTMPNPSSVKGVQLSVQCGNSAWVLLDNVAWGSTAGGGNFIKNYSMLTLNSKCTAPGAGGTALTQGSYTAVRSQEWNGSQTSGSISTSQAIQLF
jgi:hypothetical protein